MEKKVVDLLGVSFRMFLRYWAKDSKVLSQNIIDAEQFAQQCGLSIWDAKKFNRSIEDFIDAIAEDFIKEFGNKIKSSRRKKEIFNQIKKDIDKINISESKLISEISQSEDLKKLIMDQSEEERKSWKDEEIGVYTNCVRYISKAGIEFVSKLPSFTPEALKVVVQRQEEYYKELFDILQDIHSMTNLIKNSEITYREYESFYREKVITKYGKVELLGSGIKERYIKKYDISSAYVELNCMDNEYEEEINLSEVFDKDDVVWIKGEAGSGKTTFLQWIAICSAKGDYEKINNIRNTIPIVIGLRSVEWPLNLQSIVNRITSPFGSNCPDGWISKLLRDKRVILLFDGLDEISKEKREITYNFIENTMEGYPQIKILITARNSVNDYDIYDSSCYEIMPMKIENIKKFISYWHESVIRKDAILEDKEIKRLETNLKLKIVENRSLKTLARNPLLCAMICALNFTNNEQLPEEKMQLYEKCCEMLIDARDAQKQIDSKIYENIPKLDYSRKRKILEEIAYWMMNGGVSSESKNNVIEYLEHLLKDTTIIYGHEYETEAILNFFIERSGIIREPEENVIDFVHKTFMEFLAVKAICRNCAWNVLVKEACNVNWKETIIMCFREMGKKNIRYVLKKLVDEGKRNNDDRYILIASLGASNAVFLGDDKIKVEIDNKIRAMIPPEHNRIYELAQAGGYLLPFLKDSEKYSNDERKRCLYLLEHLETEEIIPNILSYIAGNGNDDVKIQALYILYQYCETVLDEYNVREQLLNIILDSIDGDSFTTYECMVNMISNENFSNHDINVLRNVKTLRFICGTPDESYYVRKTGFFEYFKECENVILIGNIQRLDFLSHFTHITNLTIKSSGNLSGPIKYLLNFTNLKSVKKLHIETKELDCFYENDLHNMKELEFFEFYCTDERLEFNIDDFDYFSKLKKVVIGVNGWLEFDIKAQIPIWKKKRDDLEIYTCKCQFRSLQ